MYQFFRTNHDISEVHGPYNQMMGLSQIHQSLYMDENFNFYIESTSSITVFVDK